LLAACACALAAPAHAAAPGPLPRLTPSKHDALYRARVHGRLSGPEYALERARSLFDLEAVRARFGEVARADPRAATPILRDLIVRMRFLSGADRAEAKAILSRPDGAPSFPGEPTWEFDAVPRSVCEGGRPLCFHWDDNASNRDSPPATDTTPSNGIPDQVDRTMLVLDNVWDTEVGSLGYRAPLDDSSTSLNDGGGPQLDIYIADLGRFELFGYCTSDDPQAIAFKAPWAVSAYCVLDDDYRQQQFGFGQTPQEFLQVTAAHEFFHAVQFAYDWFEDLALMEGTAMWMEGQVYPAVIDRINYLRRSALSYPDVPLDTGADGFEYGAWLYWRFLTEKVFAGDPTIIRDIWDRADGSAAATFGDEYSFQATKGALAARGKGFRDVFARFGAANRLRDYSEGDLYPVAPFGAVYRLGPGATTTRWKHPRLQHMATRFIRFQPNTRSAGRAHLNIRVDLPALYTGPAATVIVHRRSGVEKTYRFALNQDGKGHRTVNFGRARVWKIDLVLSNGSARFDCPPKRRPESVYSCGGWSRDDNRAYSFRARVD
jgi:hypothetical protein